MLARLVFDSIKYLDERAQESNNLNQRNKQCLVILHREIALNTELLFECARFGIQAGLKKQLLMSTQDAAIEAISHIGITVSSLFDKDNLSWSPQQSRVKRLERGQYKKRLDRIHNKQVLIERSYHRLKIARIYAQCDCPKPPDSILYVANLFLASKFATSSADTAY